MSQHTLVVAFVFATHKFCNFKIVEGVEVSFVFLSGCSFEVLLNGVVAEVISNYP